MKLLSFSVIAATAVLAVAEPAPTTVEAPAATASYSPITNSSQMLSIIDGIKEDGEDFAMGIQELLGVLNAIVPIAKPTSIPEALARLAKIYAQNYQNLFINGASILLNGLCPNDATTIFEGQNSDDSNNNTLNPLVSGIYPKSPEDAPYDVSETQLRSAIYFPPDFTHGKIKPIIFVPGTGGYAGQHFAANAAKIFKAEGIADPIFLNPPNAMLDDVQTNAEYVAYAVNYVYALTSKKPTIYTWSQGGIATRWASKYWPSTRNATQNGISISPDFHGTTLAYLIDPEYPRSATAPSVVQQAYNSTFIATLRNNGGDSPFYPLTTVFSAFDEIVEPQGGTGIRNASGYSSDKNHVGVTNIYLQATCPALTPGGTVYNTHEGTLYNALAIAAARNAIESGRNADLRKINATAQCTKYAADGLSLSDILATEASIPIAAVNMMNYPNKTAVEPKIKAYAVKDIPAGYCNGC